MQIQVLWFSFKIISYEPGINETIQVPLVYLRAVSRCGSVLYHGTGNVFRAEGVQGELFHMRAAALS